MKNKELDKCLKSLKEKHDSFIGNRRDQITSANADGFKQGLSWAINSIETLVEQGKFESKYIDDEEYINPFIT